MAIWMMMMVMRAEAQPVAPSESGAELVNSAGEVVAYRQDLGSGYYLWKLAGPPPSDLWVRGGGAWIYTGQHIFYDGPGESSLNPDKVADVGNSSTEDLMARTVLLDDMGREWRLKQPFQPGRILTAQEDITEAEAVASGEPEFDDRSADLWDDEDVDDGYTVPRSWDTVSCEPPNYLADHAIFDGESRVDSAFAMDPGKAAVLVAASASTEIPNVYDTGECSGALVGTNYRAG